MKTTYKVNGIQYDNINDIPEDVREKIDKNKNGIVDFIENKDLTNTKSCRRINISFGGNTWIAFVVVIIVFISILLANNAVIRNYLMPIIKSPSDSSQFLKGDQIITQEEAKDKLIQKYPELAIDPGLPPHMFYYYPRSGGWIIVYTSEGSGVQQIFAADCFYVNDEIQKIGSYKYEPYMSFILTDINDLDEETCKVKANVPTPSNDEMNNDIEKQMINNLNIPTKDEAKKQSNFKADGNGNYYGSLSITGYPAFETMKDPLCESNCDEYEYISFAIVALDNVSFYDFLKEYKGNSFAGEDKIGIGCNESDLITYYNDSDKFGMKKYTLSKELSGKILNSTKEKPITLNFERLLFTGGSDAPDCYSHITNIREN